MERVRLVLGSEQYNCKQNDSLVVSTVVAAVALTDQKES
jgi:hypothetical protein